MSTVLTLRRIRKYIDAYKDILIETKDQPGSLDILQRAGLLYLSAEEIAEVELLASDERRRIDDMWHYGRKPTPPSAKQPIPESLRWEVWERDRFTCQACGTRRMLSVDHIIPESKGGILEPENLQTLCRSCNSKKGNREK